MNQVLYRSLLIASLVATPGARRAQAQATPCPYDACALRLRRGSLVQGLGATPVVRLRGWFSAPRIEAFEHASDSARTHYLAFRALYYQGAKLRTAGLALLIASGIVTLSTPHANNYYVPLAMPTYPHRDLRADCLKGQSRPPDLSTSKGSLQKVCNFNRR